MKAVRQALVNKAVRSAFSSKLRSITSCFNAPSRIMQHSSVKAYEGGCIGASRGQNCGVGGLSCILRPCWGSHVCGIYRWEMIRLRLAVSITRYFTPRASPGYYHSQSKRSIHGN
jgi:hypothetical protein